MSEGQSVSHDVEDPHDWDAHWEAYGEAAEGNPANVYRRRLLVELLGPLTAGAVVLDIGSGQGEFAVFLKQQHPDVHVWGVEYSTKGVTRSRQAAQADGVSVRFVERDLLQPVEPEPDQPLATQAICSEVLEHVEDPTMLVRNSVRLLAPGCRVVVTVPGGPRSAFDHHIGHHQHFTAASLSKVLTDGGLAVDRVFRAGFPFFNLYKLAVIARGKRLVADVQDRDPKAPPSAVERAVTKAFNGAFAFNRRDSRLGWQMVALSHVPAAPPGAVPSNAVPRAQ